MSQQQSTAPPRLDMNKSFGAGGFALVGGALARLVIRFLNYKEPGFLDDATEEAINTIFEAGCAWFGAYLIPHTQGG